jgi:ATP-dependent protease ClpP protease subunit
MYNIPDLEEIVVNEFSEESAAKFQKNINKFIEIFGGEVPIVINIDSYGGNVDSLIKMLEMIASVPNIVITHCSGKAMSAGAVLLAAGTHRFIGTLSRVMVHEVRTVIGGSISELTNDFEETKKQNAKLYKLLKQFIKDEKKYDKLLKMITTNGNRDVFLEPQDCLDLGIVDHIGAPIVKQNISYSLLVAPNRFEQKSEEIKMDAKPKTAIKPLKKALKPKK